MHRLAGLLLVFTILVPTTALAQSDADRAGVRQAATDYVDALYQVDSMRVIRSVHPELVKYGYYTRDGAYRGTPMTFTELKQLAVNWNKDQRRVDPDTVTKEVVVLDVPRTDGHGGRPQASHRAAPEEKRAAPHPVASDDRRDLQ